MTRDAAAAFERAAALHRAGDLQGAAQAYGALLCDEPAHVDALLNLASLHLGSGRTGEAHALLQRALRAAPRSARVHGNMAILHQALGRLDEAVGGFEQALALDPHNADLRYGLATALQAAGRDADAEAHLRSLVQAAPDHPEGHYALAVLLHRRALDDEAIAHYRAALHADADFAEAALGLGSLLVRRGQHAEALRWLDLALDIDAEWADARLARALALQGLQRDDDAAQAFQGVLALEPTQRQALLGLASVHERQRRYDQALPLHERLVSLDAGQAGAHARLGEALRQLGRYPEAERALRRACALKPDDAEHRALLGRVLLEAGDLPDAHSQLSQAAALAPDRPAILYYLTQCGRVRQGDTVLQQLEALLPGRSRLSPPDQEQLHFALAKTLDDVGAHERAFQHLLAANALRRGRTRYDERAALQSLESIRRAFGPERMSGGASPSTHHDMGFGLVFVLGMPRSGTTLVEQVLASHPEVQALGETSWMAKAVGGLCQRQAFSPAVGGPATADPMHELGAAYIASMPTKADRRLWYVDKSLDNFRFVGPIRLALPHARIVHVVRDPVDTCLSCFGQAFDEGTQDFSYDLAELGRFYRAYEALMDHWRSVLPAGTMLEVRYEDLVADLEVQSRRLLDHCGLPWHPACLSPHQARRPVRTASVAQVRQPVYTSSVGRWRPAAGVLQPLLDALAGRATAA